MKIKYVEVEYLDGKKEIFQATCEESPSFLKVLKKNGDSFTIPISNIRKYREFEKSKQLDEYKPRDNIQTIIEDTWVDGIVIDVDDTDIMIAITDPRYMNYNTYGSDFKIATVNKNSDSIKKKRECCSIWKKKR